MKRLIIATAIVAASLGQANADLLGGRITEHDLNIANSDRGAVTSPGAHFGSSSEASSTPRLLGGKITEHDLAREASSSQAANVAAHFRNNPDVSRNALLGGRITARDLHGNQPQGEAEVTVAEGAESGTVAAK